MRRRFIQRVSDFLKEEGEKEKSKDYILKLDAIFREKDSKAMFGKTTTSDFSTKLNLIVKHTTNNITVETKDTMRKVTLCWAEESTKAVLIEHGSLSKIENGKGTWVRISKAPKLDFETRDFVGNREKLDYVEKLEEVLKTEPFRVGQISTRLLNLVIGAGGYDKMGSTPTQDYSITISLINKDDLPTDLRFTALTGELLPFGYIIAGTNVIGLKGNKYKLVDEHIKGLVERSEKSLVDVDYAPSVVYMDREVKAVKRRQVNEVFEGTSTTPVVEQKKPSKLPAERSRILVDFLEKRTSSVTGSLPKPTDSLGSAKVPPDADDDTLSVISTFSNNLY